MKTIAFCLAAVMCFAANAQQALRAPQLTPFGDAQWWVLTEPLPFRIGRSREVITVPRGFVTDLASTPRFLWSALPRTGAYMSPAVLHDYLYWDQRCARKQADEIFRIEMADFGVDATVARLIFAAVDELGTAAWSDNAAAQNRGVTRFMPEAMLAEFLSQPFDAASTWVKFHGQISAAGKGLPAGSDADPNRALGDTCTRAIQAHRLQ
jgi:hypothetical protein